MHSVIDTCLNIIASIKENGITEAELERAKQQLRGELLLSMENTINHMSRLGKSELTHNRVITIDEMVNEIMSVSLEQVHKLAKKLFDPENFGLALIGPFKEDVDLKTKIKKIGI
ncbi:MAG: Peptidase M16 domain protein [Clostridia bacterium 41_269]|nr:MAG: Peptidase M16 domain protein [Clostridia bacterium 41_269]